MPQAVLDAVADHLALEAAVGGYEAKRRRADELAAVYDACAALIGAEAGEIALLENATRAWDAAFYALPLRRRRPDPDGSRRVRLELPRVPAAAPHAGCRGGRRRRRRARPDRRRRPARRDRRAHPPDRAHPRADERRPRESGRGGRRRRARGRRDVPPRRLPVRGPAAARRGRARLRRALQHRPEVPARAARHRLPVRTAGSRGPARTARRRRPLRAVDGARRLRAGARRAPVRDVGDELREPARARRRGADGARHRRRPDVGLRSRAGRRAADAAVLRARRRGARQGRRAWRDRDVHARWRRTERAPPAARGARHRRLRLGARRHPPRRRPSGGCRRWCGRRCITSRRPTRSRSS